MFYPLKFKPIYKDYIWGGRNLERFGKILPEGTIAESWEISGLPEGMSRVSNGEHLGKSLYEVLDYCGRQIIGHALPEKFIKEFPLLVKLIDANQKLSIQVHPNDDYVSKNEDGGKGKNEAWYILDAKPGSKIIYDINPGINGEALMNAIHSGNVDGYFQCLNVSAGDVIDIPAGTVHAIGEGIILAEVQQSSNNTYRLYDYNRVDKNGSKRELHIEKAIEVIDFGSGGRDGKVKGLEVILDGSGKKSIKVANDHFSLEVYEISGQIKENADGSKFSIFMCIQGQGEIHYEGGREKIYPGETVLIPAWLGAYSIIGRAKLIKSYVPDVEKDVFSVLTASGYTKDQIYYSVGGLKKTKY